MFPVGNPWALSLPLIKGREKEGEAKCSDLQWGQSSSRYACLRQSGPQPRRVWCLLQAGAEKPMSDHPGEGCALGEPFHILPRGLDSSCPIELVGCWTLISSQNPSGPASIKLKEQSEDSPKITPEGKEKAKGTFVLALLHRNLSLFLYNFQFFLLVLYKGTPPGIFMNIFCLYTASLHTENYTSNPIALSAPCH